MNEPRRLPFVDLAELKATVPDTPDWIWDGYLAPGAVTLLAGAPKVGKTTFLADLLTAIIARSPQFLDRTLNIGDAAILVTEEASGTLAAKLPADGPLRILTRDRAFPRPTWTELVHGSAAEAKRTGARLLIIDTLAHWAQWGKEQEASAGRMLDGPIEAASDGLAILVIHHQRKAGGEDGEAVRGNNAIVAAADCVIELERAKNGAPRTERHIIGLSRWPDTTPPLVIANRETDGTWHVVGKADDRDEAHHVSLREHVLAAIPATGNITTNDLDDKLPVDRRRWHPALMELVNSGQVQVEGQGKKGDPKRYCRAEEVDEKKPSQDSFPNSFPKAEGIGVSIPSPLPVGKGRNETTIKANKESIGEGNGAAPLRPLEREALERYSQP